MYSTMGSGMLGLEMSLHHHPPHQPPQTPQIPSPLQQHPHSQMVAFGHHEAEHHPQTQQSAKQIYPFAPRGKPQQLTLSDEDEPGDSAGDGKTKNISPWQRMKWTDSMVKLLIMVVFYIGDETGSEGNDPAVKKKAVGVLQKKGKWKSVSRAMMERGFYVSPQQCEDKFNDLNKRYKRVNDILGKGTACRVVENQSLLDTMDHLTPKKKEEVKKLLNSKHLFFREMCAYHNSCGGGGGSGASVAHHSPDVGAEAPQPIQQQLQGQRCFHSSDNALIGRSETDGSKMAVEEEEVEDEEEDESEDENDDEDNEDEDEIVGVRENEQEHEEDDNGDVKSSRKMPRKDDNRDDKSSRKRPRKGTLVLSSPLIQQLSTELVSVVQDGTKSLSEKGHWMKSRSLQLEEQRVSYQFEAFEIEKQRLKWVKFSTKKEREMERDKLKNERMRLENERMLLLLRQKELELLELQQQQQICSNKRSDPSSITG
ncbi:Trihelix transcription factor [Actinidia chinensis var. chinensis]|uniref:Trihelix transcription factor n=1 Tax=Actinidia chinensis var. chinensis TaxID=1590841 RepID=A0A2R6PXM7_ACTCC|nr:Trihelix transcription factor [Actinidia chinensis var. chinensis]